MSPWEHHEFISSVPLERSLTSIGFELRSLISYNPQSIIDIKSQLQHLIPSGFDYRQSKNMTRDI